ncbi:integrase [Rhodoligotrophos appendicifer]|uniref:site-specific integrase n=1 Tax=Rhodoligotrophos appendicifer TaxID=987056 RepID=UPI00147961EB|nr:site-specific integrase [Rhodoligotrophos appendicifer]
MRASKNNYVHKLGQSTNLYYLRVVPPDVASKVRRKRWKVSLDTSDERLAQTKARELAARHDRLIIRLRAPDPIEEAEALLPSLTFEERQAIDAEGGVRGYLKWVKDRQASGERAAYKAEMLHDLVHLDGEADEDESEATIAALRAESDVKARQVAKHTETLKKLKLDQKTAKSGEEALTLVGLYPLWYAAKSPSVGIQFLQSAKLFQELNPGLRLTDIRANHIRDFRNTVSRLPNLNQKGTAGLSVTKLLAIAEKKNLKRLAPSSAAKHLRCVKALLSFAASEGLIESNPASDIRIHRGKGGHAETVANKRRSLAPSELETILVKAEDEWKDDDQALWFLRVLIYTGARGEEIAQLAPGDIKRIGGVHVIHIHDLGTNKVKTASSVRTVPVHPKLLADGFLDFTARAVNSPYLFDLKPNGQGRRYASIGKRLSKLIRGRAGITDKRVVVHSLRHTFKDSSRLIEAPEEVVERIMGHSSGDRKVARGYGDAGAMVTRLAGWMAKIDPLDPRREVSEFESED